LHESEEDKIVRAVSFISEEVESVKKVVSDVTNYIAKREGLTEWKEKIRGKEGDDSFSFSDVMTEET